MGQLGELLALHDEFVQRKIQVVAVSNEETSMRAHRGVKAQLSGEPPFPVLADMHRAQTQAYDRTTAYYLDKRGRVRQVFPMEIYARPSSWFFLNEIDRLRKDG